MSKENVDHLIPLSQDLQRHSQPVINSRKAYDYPFSQYNLLVECYNSDCNRLDDIYLEQMPESELYRFTFQMLSKPMGKVISAFSLTFLPILNFMFYAIILKSYSQYNRAIEVFNKNLQLISNPFSEMIFSPEVCEIMGRNHWFFQVEEKDIYGFSFQNDTILQLKQRSEFGQIKFMVYDESFLLSYRQFPKFRALHLTWVILSTILLGIFAFLTVELFLYTLRTNNNDDVLN